MGVSIAKATGLEMTHVPYKGGPPIVQDLLAGQIACSLSVVSNVLPNVQSGRLRALAITSSKRSPVLPSVPLAAKPAIRLPKVSSSSSCSSAMGRRTKSSPTSEVRKALETEALKEGLAKRAFEPAGSTPDELAQLVKSDIDRWGAIVKQTGFKPIE